MIFQFLKVFARKYGLHFLRQFLGVVASRAESDNCAYIAENSVFYGLWKLIEVLVGDSQIEPVFTSLGKD